MGDLSRTADFRLFFNPTGDLLEAARSCEAGVFLQAYGNTAAQFEDEYGPYEDASHFIVLADSSDDVVATSRLIAPSPVGLKTIHDLAGAPWFADGARALRAVGADVATVWEIATIAVRKDRPVTRLAFAALLHGVLQTWRANTLRWTVMMLDERARRLLEMSGYVARPIPGTRPAPYLGSRSTVPLVGDVPAMMDNQRRINPDAHRLMTLGVGLTGISVAPLAEWRVKTPSLVHHPERGLSKIA